MGSAGFAQVTHGAGLDRLRGMTSMASRSQPPPTSSTRTTTRDGVGHATLRVSVLILLPSGSRRMTGVPGGFSSFQRVRSSGLMSKLLVLRHDSFEQSLVLSGHRLWNLHPERRHVRHPPAPAPPGELHEPVHNTKREPLRRRLPPGLTNPQDAMTTPRTTASMGPRSRPMSTTA